MEFLTSVPSLLGLRVRFKSSSRVTKLSQHQTDGGKFQERESIAVEILPVLGEAAASVEPRNRAFDNPTLGQLDKSFGAIGTFNDFGFEVRQDFGERVCKKRPLIGAVGEQLLKEWKKTFHRGQQIDAAVAILNAGGMNDGLEQQAQRIYENMALLALDLFARIIAMRIDAGPPFSALFTLWLSMMAAVGLASRSASSRHAT